MQKIHVYTMVHNEEVVLPYFLRHYSRFAERITVFDNESDDKTAAIAKDAGAIVVPISTGGKHVVSTLQTVMNEKYKASRNIADWVICAEGDELFWHPDLPELLARYSKEGVTLPKIDGFDMVSDSPPKGNGQIYEEIKFGFPNNQYFSKRGVFHPSIDINFHPGGHNCSPCGKIVESRTPEIKLLHFRFMGFPYFEHKYEIRRKRFSEESRRTKWGDSCLEDHRARYKKECEDRAKDVRRVVP